MKYQPGKSIAHADALSRAPVASINVRQPSGVAADNHECPLDDNGTEVEGTTLFSDDNDSRDSDPSDPVALVQDSSLSERQREELSRDSDPSDPVALAQDSSLSERQREDPELQPVFAYLEERQLPEDPKDKLHVLRHSQNYCIHNQELCYLVPNPRWPDHLPCVVPKELQSELLEAYHDDLLGGHLGVTKTYDKLSLKYYWPHMRTDVETWLHTCPSCATRKDPPQMCKAPLKPLQVTRPFDCMAVDVVGPLPQTYDGNWYIVVFSDYLTKWPEAFPTADEKADTIAQLIAEQIVCRHGAPIQLLSDRGANFLSNLVQAVCDLFDIRKVNTSPYRPQTDGLVERFNGTLVTMLSMYASSSQRDWDRAIPFVLFAYRTSIQESVKEVPFFLLYGRDAWLPTDVALTLSSSPYCTYDDIDNYALAIQNRMTIIWEMACQNIILAQKKQKEYYDKKQTKMPLYHTGNLIRIKRPIRTGSPKLGHPWIGPYRIIEVKQPTLHIKSVAKPTSKIEVVHINDTKPWEGGYVYLPRTEHSKVLQAIQPEQEFSEVGTGPTNSVQPREEGDTPPDMEQDEESDEETMPALVDHTTQQPSKEWNKSHYDLCPRPKPKQHFSTLATIITFICYTLFCQFQIACGHTPTDFAQINQKCLQRIRCGGLIEHRTWHVLGRPGSKGPMDHLCSM